MISKEEFRQKCSHLIDENDITLFKKKQKARKIALSVSLTIEGFIALIVAIAIHGIFSLIVLPVLAVVAVISFVIIYLTTYFNIDSYKEKYLYGILALLLEGYTYKYSHSEYISPEIFAKSPYSAYYQYYYGEDMLDVNIPNDDGTPSDVVMHLSDLHLTKTEKDSDGDNRTVTVFSGCLGYVEFPFQFKCSLGINHHLRKTERIKFEDITFNKNFSIYTDDKLEAYVILNPKMMKKLEAFKSKSGGFSLAICDNKLYVHIEQNLFEIKISNGQLDEKIFDDIYDDIDCILSLINEIQNNNKVFKI